MASFLLGVATAIGLILLVLTLVTGGKIWKFVWFFVLYGLAKLLGRSNPLG